MRLRLFGQYTYARVEIFHFTLLLVLRVSRLLFVKVNERDRGISTQMLMFILFLFLSAYFYISLFVCMRGLVRRWPPGLQCSSTNTSCQPNGNNGGDDDDDDDIEREQASIRPASSSSEIRVGYWSSLSVGNS